MDALYIWKCHMEMYYVIWNVKGHVNTLQVNVRHVFLAINNFHLQNALYLIHKSHE